jgi:HK97 gp10 family phage protein
MAKLEGVAELTRKLNALGLQTTGRELRGTARAAMKIVRDKAAATIPVGSVPHTTYKGRRVFGGFAKRTLRLLSFIDKKTGGVIALVGPAREAFYASSFVEFGTSKMAARPWLRPAMLSSENAVLKAIGDQLRKRIERIARRGR